jgi:2-succinyl-6-hydroxy-2,4-cyclohexadiene-1-carboxylate synthase
MARPKIFALHGFLGLPDDWGILRTSLDPLAYEFDLDSVDLWRDLESSLLSVEVDIDDSFHNCITNEPFFDLWRRRLTAAISIDGQKPVIMGYSMGGRLAMQIACLMPELLSGAVFISAHPGLKSNEERHARLENDLRWAERFASSESWSNLLEAWNQQPVLEIQGAGNSSSVRYKSHSHDCSDNHPVSQLKRLNYLSQLDRRECRFDRAILARAMDTWSLGRQKDLSQNLNELRLPILFITGESDLKFTQLAADLLTIQRQKQVQRQKQDQVQLKRQHTIIFGAGHRAPWERADEFVSAVHSFLTSSTDAQ